MAIVVNAARWKVAPEVGKDEPIGRHQLVGEVDVKSDEDACLAVVVELWQHRLTGSDIRIGPFTGGSLTCFCFKAGQGRRFIYHGAGSPPAGAADFHLDPENPTGARELPAISGKWPRHDGAFDNDLAVYVIARVFRCAGTCASGDDTCGTIDKRLLDSPVGEDRTSDRSVHIVEGEGFEAGINLIENILSIFKILAGLLLTETSGARARRANELASLDDRIRDILKRERDNREEPRT